VEFEGSWSWRQQVHSQHDKEVWHINKWQQLCEFGDHWIVWVLKEAGYSWETAGWSICIGIWKFSEHGCWWGSSAELRLAESWEAVGWSIIVENMTMSEIWLKRIGKSESWWWKRNEKKENTGKERRVECVWNFFFVLSDTL